MGMLLWFGKGDDDAISLGDPGDVWGAFGDIATVLGDDRAYDELQSVPQFAEQAVTPWWLGQVREQAALALRQHHDALSDRALRVLTALQHAAAPSDA
jgi:hypothetical protein